MDVTRAQVLAYRVAAQQLHRTSRESEDLAVLRLGVQQAMGQPAALAFAARCESSTPPDLGPGTGLVLAWTLRGAPHVHRRDTMDALAAALWPLTELDAMARLAENTASVERTGLPAMEQFGIAAHQLRGVVSSATEKGAASTALSARVPAAMLRDCRGCRARHISDPAMRAASLAAGLELEPGTSPPVLVRRKGARRPKRTDLAALTALARAYLELLGPATAADVAGYVGARRADVAAHLPPDLAEVRVDGKKAWLPADRVDALRDPPDPDVVRLLGPFDPYLQARDRALIVPDKTVHKALWPVLGRPGALFVEGEVMGMWRSKNAGSTLTITVETFGSVPKSVWARVDQEAERVADARGAADVTVRRAG